MPAFRVCEESLNRVVLDEGLDRRYAELHLQSCVSRQFCHWAGTDLSDAVCSKYSRFSQPKELMNERMRVARKLAGCLKPFV